MWMPFLLSTQDRP